MHENISFHHERTRKSDKINNLSRWGDDGVMALAEIAHENQR